MSEGWRLVINSLVSVIMATVIYIVKDEISSKEKVKFSARMMVIV
ncbi:MAG: hypothetical protein ACYC21_15355 [Eubacteriales bacterium]